MARVTAISTPSLGDRSYLVTDGRVGTVVDPQRDTDRITEVASSLGVRITHVFETHLHNDYLTGGLALARETGATYVVPTGAEVEFERMVVHDGDVVKIGPAASVRVVATPGHTFHHVAYVLGEGGGDIGVFSGGSLLYGTTGRTDLVGPEHTGELARQQHSSANRLAEDLPDQVELYPTHGFGSFCSATQSDATASDIGTERRSNPVLSLDAARYVAEVLPGLDAFPAYYAHMGPLNAAGPGPADLSDPPSIPAGDLAGTTGAWVVDIRPRGEFAGGHLEGSYNFGVDGKLATYLGWLMPWGTPVRLVAAARDQVSEAKRELARIGVDQVISASIDIGAVPGKVAYRTVSFGDLARSVAGGATVLDVRRNGEWDQARIPAALHIPLHELPDRLDEVPQTGVWVHCASGYRASVAASILHAAGQRIVVVDDDFDQALRVGLAVSGPPGHPLGRAGP